VSLPSAAVAISASHVLGTGCDIEPAAARLAAVIDPAFLAKAGWNPLARVLSLPPGHAQLGWRMCQRGQVRQR
jgi:hypothetical protein